MHGVSICRILDLNSKRKERACDLHNLTLDSVKTLGLVEPVLLLHNENFLCGLELAMCQ